MGTVPTDHLSRESVKDGTDEALVIRNVTVAYQQKIVLRGVNARIERGQVIGIIGPNGGGKSTLLKAILGIVPIVQGSVTLFGRPSATLRHRIAYVPQREVIDWDFPVTVWDVVMMGRYPRLGPLRRPGEDDRRAVAHALARVKMEDRTGTQIGELSGGQRRRVFLARALAAEPDVFLLDEPVTGIDVTTQEDLMDILEGLTRQGKTVVATTHDLACAAQRFQDVVAMNRTVIAQGDASLVLDRDVLARTYGGHLLVLGEQAIMLDDAHHHDQAGGTERHFHDDAPGPHR